MVVVWTTVGVGEHLKISRTMRSCGSRSLFFLTGGASDPGATDGKESGRKVEKLQFPEDHKGVASRMRRPLPLILWLLEPLFSRMRSRLSLFGPPCFSKLELVA